MNGQNEGELKDLFDNFLDPKQAEKAVEDVRKAERILREHPAPEPDGELIVDIKAEIARALMHKRTGSFKRTAYKVAAIAAGFIILATISVKLFEKGDDETGTYVSRIPRAIWESDNIAADDADLAILNAEIEQIKHNLLAIQLGENNGNGRIELAELEIKLIEINSNFWKG